MTTLNTLSSTSILSTVTDLRHDTRTLTDVSPMWSDLMDTTILRIVS